MKNMIYYLKKYGTTSFAEMPFNEVDSLILSQFGYLNLDLFINHPHDEVFLKDVINKKNAHDLAYASMTRKDNEKFCSAFEKTFRYDLIYFKHLVSEINYVKCEQFFAVSFFLKDFIYISYRGTDLTLAGWQEDVNMSYLETVPAQNSALEYLKNVYNLYKKPMIIGGHSKGGNLALYAAMKAEKEIQDMILDVYDFDGPGFSNKEVFKSEGYLNIKDKLHIVSSTMSVVALLLFNPDKIEFLKTSGFTVLQHNPFNWHVKGNKLIRVKRNSITSRYLEKSVSRFFSIVGYGDRRRFFNLLFFIAKDHPKSSLLDVKRHPIRYFIGAKNRRKTLDKEDIVFLKYIKKTIRISFTSSLKQDKKDNKKLKIEQNIENNKENNLVLNNMEVKGNE